MNLIELKELAKNYNKENDLTFVLDEICEDKFEFYYSGWELDTEGWIMKDGSMFATNHGSVEEYSKERFDDYKLQMINHLKSLDTISELLK